MLLRPYTPVRATCQVLRATCPSALSPGLLRAFLTKSPVITQWPCALHSISAQLFCYVSSHARSHALPSLSPHMPPLPENIPQAVPLHLHPSNPAIFFSHLPPRIREPKTLVARWIFLTIISPNMPSPSLSWRRVIGNVTHHSITPASKKENSKKESRPSTRLSLRTDS